MSTRKDARNMRLARHGRVRNKVSGDADRPRLSVFRSLHYVYVQVIDDDRRHTLLTASSRDEEIKHQRDGKAKKDISRLVGLLIAKRANGVGISRVVLDRGGYKYHGRVKALAEGAREGGLIF